ADEPTSALDPHLRDNFVEQLFASSRAAGSTVILVSHDPELGRHFDEVMDLRDLNRAEEHP
ncbi:MAG: ABC transporter ATP-binding protein, partial [Verrucomicrobiia bacterium]